MVVRWYIADMVDVLSKSIGICHILLLASCIYWTDSQVLSPCTDKNDGDPCLLSCQTPVVNQPITISQSPAYTNGGTCLGGNCFPADSNFNISQTGTTTTLEILSFKKSDNGTWRCEYGTIDTHSIFISWSKIPTSITELSGLTSNATITADLTISVEVGCLYSLQDPTVTLQLMCDGALASSYDMSSSPSTTVCSDSDLTAYICNYTMTSNPPSQTCNSGYTGYSLKALVSLFGTSKTYEKEIFPSFSVSFESTGGDGGGGSSGGALIAGIIVAFIAIIVITIIICCLFNKRCRSRYLRKDSRCLFTCPRKDIVVIDIHDDKDLTIVRPTGEKIEIQCLRTEIGWYVFDDKVLHVGNGVKVMNNPCMLFNPFFEICCLEMKHEGLYTYKRGNDSKNGCMLTMEICKDIIISSKPCVYWAHEGEWIKLQLVQTSVVVEHWIKKNTENKKEIIIPNPQKKSSLVLQNINNKDAGSYIAANTSETWKSGCLTLKIVNSLVTVGKKDDSYVTMIKNSIKLKFIGCKLANIKLLKWKKSLLTEGTEIRELESTSNYELILSKMTKNDEGRYWCEVTNIDDTSTNSGILTLHVVHDIVNVGLSPASCSATIGDSIQIRYFNEIIPQQIIFTAKRSGFNQIAPERKVTKITDTASLFIEEISKEDEGCYLFASADGDAISGVLTLSVIEGNERYNNLYLGQSESGRSAFQPRNGANTFLDAIPKKEDIQETPDKKKKKKGKKTKKEKEKAEEVDETA